jgi:hypothetical protein
MALLKRDLCNVFCSGIFAFTSVETVANVNFLHLTITKKNELLFRMNVYRELATTDSIIPKDYCHPLKQRKRSKIGQ